MNHNANRIHVKAGQRLRCAILSGLTRRVHVDRKRCLTAQRDPTGCHLTAFKQNSMFTAYRHITGLLAVQWNQTSREAGRDIC